MSPSMDQPILSKPLLDAIVQFLQYTPAQRLSRNLRNMLIYYTLYEQDGYPSDMQDLLMDLLNLFRLLDTAIAEWPEKNAML